MTRPAQAHVGVVAIGRNEGERLTACLRSVTGTVSRVVYVDSGSTDGSVATARSLGAEVVELDMAIPFTAARARNEGFARLLSIDPGIEWVQFVDGDCEMTEGWLERAGESLETRPDVAAVCGRLRERHPESSIYNRLCDIEWDTPVGEVMASGGIAMMRVAALTQAVGFSPGIIAGEEPELCARLRQAGWKILRLDVDMATHDAAMTRFAQWWKRAVRAGHAYAELTSLHGRGPMRYWVRMRRSILLWGYGLPALILLGVWPTSGWSLALALGYPVLALRVYGHTRARGYPAAHALLYALACVVAKFPQAQGILRHYANRFRGRGPRLIEYK